MVKTVELMGLATFNIFVALTLSATVLTSRDEDAVKTLTEANITGFVNEVATVSAGLKDGMDDHTVVTWLMEHLTENGRYVTAISYKIADDDEQERAMDMGRLEFISYVLQGQKSMTKHETKTNVDYIKIDDDGRGAKVVVTNYERGMMPMDDGFGDSAMVPVLGMSYCEQRVILTDDRVMQIDGATCTTTINFEESF